MKSGLLDCVPGPARALRFLVVSVLLIELLAGPSRGALAAASVAAAAEGSLAIAETSAAEPPDLGPTPSEIVTVSYLEAAPYYEWSLADRAYLSALWKASPAVTALPADSAEVVDLAATLYTELSQLQTALDRIRSAEGYFAPRGYELYRPQTTGKLLSLDWALQARLRLLRYVTREWKDPLEAQWYPPIDELGGNAFDPASRKTARYADPLRVIAALDAIPVSDAAFEGYQVFLLPYGLAPATGYSTGRAGYVGAHGAGPSFKDEAVATHEFAHYFACTHLQPFRNDASTWSGYVSARGLPGFEREAASRASDAWRRSTSEAFAEDFRVLMGSPAAAADPPETAFGDPREMADLAQTLRAYYQQLQGAYQPQPLASEGVGVLGARTVLPRGLGDYAPMTTYALADEEATALPFLIAAPNGGVQYCLFTKDETKLQDWYYMPLTDGLFTDELRLTEGPGVYRLSVTMGKGGRLYGYNLYVIVAASGSAKSSMSMDTADTAVSVGRPVVWTSDPRLVLDHSVAGLELGVHREGAPVNDHDFLSYAAPGCAAAATNRLTLNRGDGVYVLDFQQANMIPGVHYRGFLPTRVVLDQAADAWSPPVVRAGDSLPVTTAVAVSLSDKLCLTGSSEKPAVSIVASDASSGAFISGADAKTRPDGTFSATIDLAGATEGTYLVWVATGPEAGGEMIFRWWIVVRVDPAANATGSGSSAASGEPGDAFLEAGGQALASGDVGWAAFNYVAAMREAAEAGGSQVNAAAFKLLDLLTASAGSNYGLIDAVVRALQPPGGWQGRDQIALGKAYAQAYRRREALKAFQAAGAAAKDAPATQDVTARAGPVGAAAAKGLYLVSDPDYTWVPINDDPGVILPRLSDIGMWAQAAIERMNLKGVVKGLGDGTFGPDRQVTRDQAVTMVVRVLGLEAEALTGASGALPYADSASIAPWARGYVATAYAHGLIDLREPSFRATDAATRAEVAVMLVRGLGTEAAAAAEASAMPGRHTSLVDDAEIPEWARGYLAYAVQNGIVGGYEDNTIRPNNPVKRGEMAALTARIDDRTQTAIDACEIKGVVERVEAGLPAHLYLQGEAADHGRALALNCPIYQASRAISLSEVQPGARVRLIGTGDGVVGYVEVLDPSPAR